MNYKSISKYLLTISLLVGISLFFLSFRLHNVPQSDNNILKITDDDQIVYWFYASVRIDDRTNTYKMSGTPGGIQWGYQTDFEKDLWKNLSTRKVAIGPFLNKNEAINAKRLYKSKKTIALRQIPKDTVPPEVYWFAISFDQSDRLRIYVMERSPAAVQTGNENQFINAFFEQLGFKLLSIGPFYSYDNAETAKNLYRKNE